MQKQHIYFETIAYVQAAELLTFEAREFPEWLEAFQRVIALGDYDDLLVGRDATGQIVASLIMYTPQSNNERLDVLWQAIFGKSLGLSVASALPNRSRGRVSASHLSHEQRNS